MTRLQSTTLGELRASGVHGLLIFCSNNCCSYSISIDADWWPDATRVSELEDNFTCTICGARGADIRPDFD
jgi:hypothetical protein